MNYIVPEIYTGRRFLKNRCFSQQIISGVAKESLIPYNLTHNILEVFFQRRFQPLAH